jgi:hypothetical protein
MKKKKKKPQENSAMYIYQGQHHIANEAEGKSIEHDKCMLHRSVDRTKTVFVISMNPFSLVTKMKDWPLQWTTV